MKPQNDLENTENLHEIIEDVEIVDPAAVISNGTTAAPSDTIGNDLTTLVAIEGAIKNHLEQLEKIKEASRVQKEMVESVLQSDPIYTEADKEAKKATKVKSEARRKVMGTAGNKDIESKLKELKQQSKEISDGLSYYLGEFRRITGANEFEGADGKLKEIVLVAKLVNKRS